MDVVLLSAARQLLVRRQQVVLDVERAAHG
jgi:hypothetical protein